MPPNLQLNPFKVQSPEKLRAEDAVDLFVNVFTDFYKVKDAGHAFLSGPRGTGKSMMFRYLRPDCQCLAPARALHEIEFFSVYVPLKNTSLQIAELERVDDRHASTHINEHLMTLYFAVEALNSVIDATSLADPNRLADPANRKTLLSALCRLLRFSGVSVDEAMFLGDSALEWLRSSRDYVQKLYSEGLQYVRQLAFLREVPPPKGPLLGYMDFLYPLFEALKSLTFMPSGPVYVLVDDADNLSLAQTRILNTWVSSRTSAVVSLKISTQMEYKTHHTTTGRTIDATHDFSEVNIADIYTSYKGKYLARVREIVEKRLRKYGVRDAQGSIPLPERFFPAYDPQERAIDDIKRELVAKFERDEGRGFRASDDAVRYARPTYMANLAGARKSSSKYMYAGFDQLVHISSGIVRHFLEPAAHMFSEVQSRDPQSPITEIPPAIQDEGIRADSNNFRFSELEKIRDDQATNPAELDLIEKLGNVIEVLGGVFRQCLLTEGRSERRVFSIALYDQPDDELREVLRLGIRYGYFHCSSIGKKDGTGRTRLYILSRRLAPAFNLDPNGFVGYLWLSSGNLKEAIQRPMTLLNRIKNSGIGEFSDVDQLTLFE